MDKKQFKQLAQKLDIIISLLLRSQLARRKGAMTVRDQIALLNKRKMRPVEIAKILGKTQPFVNKELSIIRRESRKSGVEKKENE